MGVLYFVQFLLEVEQDLRLIPALFFAWFYIRFFMKSKLNDQQVGD